MPLVSIITPYYNTGEIFHETARSVFSQTFHEWEWIIVNDGSTNPGALATLEQYRHKDRRVTVIDHAKNKGLSATRNTGARAASTDYLMFLDSDDLLELTCVEKLYWKLKTHPELAFADAYCTGFGAQNYIWKKGFSNGPAFLKENFATSNAMVRRNAFDAVGGFDENRKNGLEDWDFWLKCAANGYWGCTIPEPLTCYRRRDDHGKQWSNLREQGLADFKASIPRKYPRLTAASFPQPVQEWHMPFQPVSLRIPNGSSAPERKKPAIVFIIPHFEMGGADKWNLDLITELATKHGWHVTIAATNTAHHSWISHFKDITKDIHVLSQFLTLPEYPRYLLHLLSTRAPDIVCLSNSRIGYSLLPVLHAHHPKIPFVDYVHMEEEHWRSGGYAMDSIRLSPFLTATGVTSDHLKEWMITRGGSDNKIKPIYINIDTKKWSPIGSDKMELYEKWRIPHDKPVILYAGRLALQKQPDIFAQTVEKILQTENAVTFVVAGDGPLASIINKLQDKHASNVRWVGSVKPDEIKELLSISDIFFLPSQMEGISLAFYEAMSMGVVPVGADVGGQRELVTSECGFLIKKSDDEATQYAYILKQLLGNRDELKKRKAACRARTVEHFDISRMTAAMLKLFSEAQQRIQDSPPSVMSPDMARTYATEIIEQIRLERLADGLWAERGDPNFNKLFRNSKISPKLSKVKRSILRFIMKHF